MSSANWRSVGNYFRLPNPENPDNPETLIFFRIVKDFR